MSDNLNGYFKSLFSMAHEKSLNSKFVEADDICHRLLREPALPLLYRAGCNLLLAFGNDNPVGFAKEAVYWYKEMYDEVKDHPVDGPHHKLLLEQAQDALDNAEKEAAEQAEQADGEDEDEEEAGEGDAEKDVEAETDDKASEKEESQTDVEMVPESDVEKGQTSAPSSSQPTVVPSSSMVMGTASTLPTQPSQVVDTTTQEKKKTSSDEE